MNAEQALQRVKDKLLVVPVGRIVNTGTWDAIPLADALRVVDEVAAELRKAGR
jgi:hypothetical protein